MKKVFFVLGLLFLSGIIFGQGIRFEEGSLDEAMAKAKSENKIIFVDVSTSWCAPCQRMVREVFPRPFVGSYYNATFINCKLDGDSKEGKAFSKKYDVDGFPYFLFLDSEGNVIYRFVGYRNTMDFLEEAEKVPEVVRFGGWEKMNADFEAGRSDSEFLKVFYKFADKKIKPLAFNAYLKSLPDDQLFTKAMTVLYDDISVYDSVLMNRLVDGVLKYKDVYTNYEHGDYHFYFVASVEFCLSHFLDSFIEEGNLRQTKEMKRLEAKIQKVFPVDERDIDWASDRGTVFMSKELIELIYARKNDKSDFLKRLPVYMENMMTTLPLDTVYALMDRFFDGSNPKQYAAIDVMYDFLERKGGYFTSNMLDFVDYYWRNMPSDKKTVKQCVEWVNYLSSLNLYERKNPFVAADLLVRLDHKKDAVAVIERFDKIQQELGCKNELIAAQIQQKLWEIRNNK